MPRSKVSSAGQLVGFFRSAPIETAEMMLDLCKETVSERKTKSQEARARAVAAPGVANRVTGVPHAAKSKPKSAAKAPKSTVKSA